MIISNPLNRHVWMLKSRVQEICKPFFNTFGFNYFEYIRGFSNGSFGGLTTDTSLLEYLLETDATPLIESYFNEVDRDTYSCWLFPDEIKPEPSRLKLAREKFNLYCGIGFLRRFRSHYDLIYFALPKPQEQPGYFYLNRLRSIEQFINQFENNHKDLLALMNKDAIFLPKKYQDVHCKSICLNKNKVGVIGQYGPTHITLQELACLHLLLQGRSYKYIAQILEISARTVETYILRIKNRTGFSSQFALEKMLLSISVGTNSPTQDTSTEQKNTKQIIA